MSRDIFHKMRQLRGLVQPLKQGWGSHNLATALINADFTFNREILVSYVLEIFITKEAHKLFQIF